VPLHCRVKVDAEQLVDRNLTLFAKGWNFDFSFLLLVRIAICKREHACGMYGGFYLASYYHLVLDNIYYPLPALFVPCHINLYYSS
jgi:hypothetical protein